MSWLNRIIAFLQRERRRRETEEEIAFHIEAAENQLLADGVSAAEAHRLACIRFGRRESIAEQIHQQSALPLENLAQDIRFGLRLIRKNPVFSTVVVLSLTLGIGANVAIFTVMQSVMLNSLPVRSPEQLFMLQSSVKQGVFPERYMHDYEGSTWVEGSSGLQFGTSMPSVVYDTVRTQASVFDGTFAFASNEESVNVGLPQRAESGRLQGVSGSYFDGLGVLPYMGRMLEPADDVPSAAPVVVVGYKFFVDQLNADPAAIGTTISINQTAAQVVGVAPPDFFGLDPTVASDFWIPLPMYKEQWKRSAGAEEGLDNPFNWWLTVVGRLKPGVTPQQAQAETSVLFARTIGAPLSGKLSGGNDVTVPSLRLESASRGLGYLRQRYSTSLWLLAGIAVIVLLIACANVATLTLARGNSRRAELATRLSLGASNARVIRQLMTECVMLALAGGLLGVAASHWMTSALVRVLNSRSGPLGIAVRVNPQVLLFALAVSLVCSLLFGLAPAIQAIRLPVGATLKQAATVAPREHRFGLGKGLIVMQIALCVMLVTSAGLLLRTLHKLQSVHLGFSPENLTAFTVRPGLNGYDPDKLLRYYDDLRQRVSSLAGVRSATFAQFGPVAEGSSSSLLYIPGFNTPEKRSEYNRHIVGDSYFDTLRIPIVMGRPLGELDTRTSKGVIVVNEKLVAKYFHGQNPVGRQVVLGSRKNPKICEIVGVARDVRYAHIRDEVPPTVYIPIAQTPYPLDQVSFFLHTAGGLAGLENSVRTVALQLDPGVPVVDFRSEPAVIQRHLSLERAFALLSTAFAVIGMLLACIGLYGTVAGRVTRRTGEIGVRLALGATRANILMMILVETLWLVLIGLAIGLPAAWISGSALRAQLYGLSSHDSLTQICAVAMLLLVTICAAIIPARRAAGIEPVTALRNE